MGEPSKHAAPATGKSGRVRRLADMRAGDLAAMRTRLQALIHDLADRARAPPALRAASEATIDLVGGRGARRGGVDNRADFPVTQNIAGTNDHNRLLVTTRWMML